MYQLFYEDGTSEYWILDKSEVDEVVRQQGAIMAERIGR